MEFDFLQPVANNLVVFKNALSAQQLGHKIAVHSESKFPELHNCKIALLGVLEKRNDFGEIINFNLTPLRQELYSLYLGNWTANIVDLGDILAGNTKEDTFFAVQQTIQQLLKLNIITVIIGYSQDVTYAMYRAYDQLEQMVNLVTIDNKFDIGNEQEPISAESYLSKIIVDEPTNLFNFSNIGYQTYYNSQEEIDLLEKMNFDAYRLGEISATISLAEPILRDADLLSIDISSLNYQASSNFKNFEPNGFTGKEICALARYAGISDKTSTLGIFNFNDNPSESKIIAQIIWYFIEGINFRWNDYPFGSKENYLKFIVAADTENIIFFKSNKSDRWWIEIPFFTNANNKLKKITLLPCSHQDYLDACNNQLPDRWWKAQQKFIN